MEITDAQIQTALRIYESQKRANKNYRERHPEKMNELSKKYYHKMKEDPDKYKMYLEKCRKRHVPKKQKVVDVV